MTDLSSPSPDAPDPELHGDEADPEPVQLDEDEIRERATLDDDSTDSLI